MTPTMASVSFLTKKKNNPTEKQSLILTPISRAELFKSHNFPSFFEKAHPLTNKRRQKERNGEGTRQ